MKRPPPDPTPKVRRNWTPLAKVLAGADSPEVLIRRCQETFVVARFKFMTFVNVEGQPARDDTTIAWSWWSLRNIRIGADFIEFGQAQTAFRVSGVEFLAAHVKLLRLPASPPEPIAPLDGDSPSVPQRKGRRGRPAECDAAAIVQATETFISDNGLPRSNDLLIEKVRDVLADARIWAPGPTRMKALVAPVFKRAKARERKIPQKKLAKKSR